MYKSYITSIEVVYDFIRGVLACIGICTLYIDGFGTRCFLWYIYTYKCIVMQPLLRPMCKGEAHFIGRDSGLTISSSKSLVNVCKMQDQSCGC